MGPAPLWLRSGHRSYIPTISLFLMGAMRSSSSWAWNSSTADDAADQELLCRLKVLLIKLSRGYQPTPREMKALQMLPPAANLRTRGRASHED